MHPLEKDLITYLPRFLLSEVDSNKLTLITIIQVLSL